MARAKRVSLRRTFFRGRSMPVFLNKFEEFKSLQYVINIIKSPLALSCVRELTEFSGLFIGEEKIIKFIKIWIGEEMPEEDISSLASMVHQLPRRGLLIFLRKEVLPILENCATRLASAKQAETERRVGILSGIFKLTEFESEIILLLFMANNGAASRILRNNNLIDLSRMVSFVSTAHIILGFKKYQISSAIREGKLIDTGILDNRHGTLDFADWCSSYLSGVGNENISHEYFTQEKETDLFISDFDIPEDEMMILDTLMRSNQGFNILFYGEPGTGKTSLAKCLGKKYGKSVLSVNTPADDDHDTKLRATFATILAADDKDALVLIDEADEMLNTDDSLFIRSRTNKSWVNNTLDTHNKKLIWITNRHLRMHPSTMRRFNFSMKFNRLDEKKRMHILRYEIKKAGVKGLLTDSDLESICSEFPVDAGGLVNALKVIETEADIDRDTAIKRIRTVLKNHHEALSGKRHNEGRKKEFASYSLEGLNCTEDPRKILDVAKKYVSSDSSLPAGQAGSKTTLSMLLYGIPGTGKSEFVYYMGHTLNKEVLLRRSSDIQSMWLGETEKNISNAFREAQDNNKILFFDEADTFLFPRKSAQRSWEISFTNEILTQLESFSGIVIFATNDIEGLDHASLRRFRFKIEFRPLAPEGILRFYHAMLSPLLSVNTHLSLEEQQMMQSIFNLTPGDFAVVKDKFIFTEQKNITHSILISALLNEVRYKQSGRDLIGFRSRAL